MARKEAILAFEIYRNCFEIVCAAENFSAAIITKVQPDREMKICTLTSLQNERR